MNFSHSQNVRGFLSGLTGYSCFSIADMIYKYLGGEYSVYLMGVWATFPIVLIVLAIAMGRGELHKCVFPTKPHWKILRGILLTLQFYAFIGAIAMYGVDMERAYAIGFSAPFVITIFAWLVFKDSTGIHHWVCILSGFVGVLLVVRPGFISFDIGTGLLICSVVILSITNLMIRVIKAESDTVLSLVFYSVVPSVLMSLTIVSFFDDVGFVVPELNHICLLVVCGALSFVGLIGIVYGFSIAKANMVAPTNYVQMLWAFIFGYFIFDSQLDGYFFVGALIVIASGMFLIWRESRDGGRQCEGVIEEEFRK